MAESDIILLPESVKRDARTAEIVRLAARFPYPVPSRFLPHLGNNHADCEPACRRGGGLHVGRHLGKPLSDDLWTDLVERVGFRQMRIIAHDWPEWSIGYLMGGVSVYLDESYLVRDLYLEFTAS